MHDTRAVAESYVLIGRQKERVQAWHGLLKLQSLLPVTHFLKLGSTHSPYQPRTQGNLTISAFKTLASWVCTTIPSLKTRGQIGLRMNAFPDPETKLKARLGKIYLTAFKQFKHNRNYILQLRLRIQQNSYIEYLAPVCGSVWVALRGVVLF